MPVACKCPCTVARDVTEICTGRAVGRHVFPRIRARIVSGVSGEESENGTRNECDHVAEVHTDVAISSRNTTTCVVTTRRRTSPHTTHDCGRSPRHSTLERLSPRPKVQTDTEQATALHVLKYKQKGNEKQLNRNRNIYIHLHLHTRTHPPYTDTHTHTHIDFT